MSFVVANATGQPPVWVEGSYSDSGGMGGISTGSGHAAMRDRCLDIFASEFGRMPLRTTQTIVRPSSSKVSILQPACWLEYFSPP